MSTAPNNGSTWKRVIGVIGGLGPYAHIEFERLLLRASAEHLGRAASDQDYPSWIVSSLPATPDRTEALLADGIQPVDALVESAERLSAADFGVIPCNTAHAFLELLRARVRLPILDMIDETASTAVSMVSAHGSIGVLAATGTLETRLYQKRIAAHASTPVITLLDLEDGPRLQESLVMVPIFGKFASDGTTRLGGGIKSGAFEHPVRREQLAAPLAQAATHLLRAGAEVILMACTEIPLVLTSEEFADVPLLDPMAVAAEASVAIASGRRDLPSQQPIPTS